MRILIFPNIRKIPESSRFFMFFPGTSCILGVLFIRNLSVQIIERSHLRYKSCSIIHPIAYTILWHKRMFRKEELFYLRNRTWKILSASKIWSIIINFIFFSVHMWLLMFLCFRRDSLKIRWAYLSSCKNKNAIR